MGRSVSRPTGAIAVCYRDVSEHGRFDPHCEECDIIVGEGDVCPSCGEDLEPGYDEFQAQEDWDDFVQWIRDTATAQWPSLEECDTWLDSEDHAILENGHCRIGVSSYCGLASIWLVSKADDHLNNWGYGDGPLANLADRWCAQIERKFRELFGEYQSIGTASNGEQFFRRVEL